LGLGYHYSLEYWKLPQQIRPAQTTPKGYSVEEIQKTGATEQADVALLRDGGWTVLGRLDAPVWARSTGAKPSVA